MFNLAFINYGWRDRIKITVTLYSIEFKLYLIVGQCIELPFIIAKGKDVNEFIEQVKKCLIHFIKAFPDKIYSVILKHNKPIEKYNVSKESSNNG